MIMGQPWPLGDEGLWYGIPMLIFARYKGGRYLNASHLVRDGSIGHCHNLKEPRL